MGFASTVCFPVEPIVDKEIGDFAEDFEQDGVVERHGDGSDGEMMSSGSCPERCVGFFVRLPDVVVFDGEEDKTVWIFL